MDALLETDAMPRTDEDIYAISKLVTAIAYRTSGKLRTDDALSGRLFGRTC